ncbi:sigma-70 family RNA polymerase sigma factor [Kordia sp. YSTF-M3]|uniref:Sigma-70 family RNA polymerase sigma factor n=1 Tax=Kordia aestuariivivens TaxID=2759037 RepID=A0ABR7QG07_9FLAO|nr:sigma-70 family RNA polymerase sigma factor [Kordia aestuariivivens]MBC8757464.1 sigma-70 family RNA polymerase sigma factor [Kordia aestuariivivens]
MKHQPTENKTKKNNAIAHQNFGLKEDEFEEMLQKMSKGDDRLFEKIFLAQFEETISYLMYRYKTDQSMAYDATMDALLKFRKRLLAGKINYYNMRFLFTQMASQFLTTAFNKRTKSLEMSENDGITTEEEVDDLILDYLDIAWKSLGDQCSKLLENFYYKKITLKELANVLGKSDAALRKQKQRCLETLRSYFLKHYKP